MSDELLVDLLIRSIAKDRALGILHHDDHLKTLSREMGIKSVAFLENYSKRIKY